MKDLIKEIEEIIVSLKRQYKNCFEEIDCPLFTSDEIRGKILAYKDCLNLLQQYKIIVAPKSIKLSEVLDKIGYDDIQIKRDNHLIFVKNSDGLLFTIDFNKLLPGRILDYVCYGDLKWLYELWIAGTKVEDDIRD